MDNYVPVGINSNGQLPPEARAAISTQIAEEVDAALEGVSVDIQGASIVYHGSSAATPRPVTDNAVIWVGSVYPLNSIVGDLVPDVEIPPDPPEVYFSDDFNRANGAPGPSPVGGISPTLTGAVTVGIVSNQLQFPTAAAATYVTWDTGHADGVYRIVLPTLQSDVNFAIVFRFSSASNMLLLARVSSTVKNYRIMKRVGSTTAVEIATSSIPMASGDVIEITLNGTSVLVKINGATMYTGTITDLPTNTRVGVGPGSASAAGGTIVDSISFTELA